MGAPIADLPPPGSGTFVGGLSGVSVGAGGCQGVVGAGFSGTVTVPIPCFPFTLSAGFFFSFAVPAFAAQISFILGLPSFFAKFLLSCSGFNITTGITIPPGGGRLSACVPDLDDFELAA
jgi:hypothetical protein